MSEASSTSSSSHSSGTVDKTLHANLEELYSCSICLDLLVQPTVLRCGHTACRGCLRTYFKTNSRICPDCRAPHPQPLQTNIITQKAIDLLMETLSREKRDEYADRVNAATHELAVITHKAKLTQERKDYIMARRLELDNQSINQAARVHAVSCPSARDHASRLLRKQAEDDSGCVVIAFLVFFCFLVWINSQRPPPTPSA